MLWTEGEKRGHISVCTCEALCEMSSGMSFVCLVEGWSEVRVAEGVAEGVAERVAKEGWRSGLAAQVTVTVTL